MRDNEQLMKIQALGEEAERFITSPLGKFMIERAEGEVKDAVEALKVIDPTDTQEIRILQNKIKTGEDFQYWLAEAVQDGTNAIEAMALMEAPD